MIRFVLKAKKSFHRENIVQLNIWMDAIASSIHPDTNPISLLGNFPDESLLDEEPEDDTQVNCCVCLLQRVTTVLFLPCRHAKCCEKCSASLKQCPLCRCNIEQRFNIFTIFSFQYIYCCLLFFFQYVFSLIN